MRDLHDMSPEEIRAWARDRAEESRRRFAGRPPVRVSRVKAEDYPHWQKTGWAFRVRDGKPARVWRVESQPAEAAVVRGLRECADGAGVVMLLETGDGVWAVRRADGEPWADRVDAPDARPVPQVHLPVRAWRVPDGSLARGATVTGPVDEPVEWVVQTIRLDDQ